MMKNYPHCATGWSPYNKTISPHCSCLYNISYLSHCAISCRAMELYAYRVLLNFEQQVGPHIRKLFRFLANDCLIFSYLSLKYPKRGMEVIENRWKKYIGLKGYQTEKLSKNLTRIVMYHPPLCSRLVSI